MSMTRSLFALFTGASAAALTIGAPAQAQEAKNAKADEIVVTASKRSQTLLETPISVAVTTAATIERSNVRDLLDLQSLVPSLRVNQLQSSANTNFIIRGFGNGANNAGIEPAVGVFIDGVYRSRSAAQISDLPNIQRVEVLRGPQSTLFGKNASAGVISIVTQEPKFEFGGSGEVSLGNYNSKVVKGDVTGPLSDKVAFSLAGNYNKNDGYAKYLNLGVEGNNRDRWGVRGQLLALPTNNLKLRFIADYDKIDEICCTVANIFDGPTGAAVRALGGKINSNQPFSYDGYANFPSSNKFENSGVSGQADWTLSPSLALTSITAYRKVKSDTNADSDFTSADIIGQNIGKTDIKTFTQEVRLASKFKGPLNFLVGAFYFNEDIDTGGQLTFGKDFRGYANLLSGGGYGASEAALRSVNPGLPAGQFGAQGQGRFDNYKYKNEATSIFGQLDFDVTERLKVTAGLNWTDDKKRASTRNNYTDVFSSIDLDASVAALRAGGIAQTVGGLLGVPGGFASAAQIQAFGTANPAALASITSAVNAQVTPLLGLKPLQFIPPFLNFPNAVESGRKADTNLSHTLRVSYKFSDNLNGYITHATGFKGASFNLSTDSRPFPKDFIPGSPVTNPAPSAIRSAGLALPNLTTGTRFAEPEDTTVYEVGLKGKWDTFSFNLAVFEQSIKGFQSNVFVGTGFVLGNAEKQSTKGVELETTFNPTPNLNLTAALTYLDPKFDKFTGGTAFNPVTRNTGPANLTGQTPSGISEFSYTVGATYMMPIGDNREIVYHVDYNKLKPYIVALGLPYKADPETLNASVALSMGNGVELSVWGRNLTEPKYNPTIFPGVAQSGTLSGYPSPPKTYGVTARYKF